MFTPVKYQAGAPHPDCVCAIACLITLQPFIHLDQYISQIIRKVADIRRLKRR
jgi:hypothetical protein